MWTANLLIFFDFPLGIQNNTHTNVNYLHGLVPDIAWFLFPVCALRGVIGEHLGVLCLSPSLIGSASVGCLYQFSHLSVTGQNKSTCLPGGWAERRCSCLGRDRRVWQRPPLVMEGPLVCLLAHLSPLRHHLTWRCLQHTNVQIYPCPITTILW
jgi:hypothetical protein